MDRPAGLTRAFAVVLLLAAAAAAQEARPDDLVRVAFEVDVTKPASGAIFVTMVISNNDQEDLRVAIPAWAPGAYRLREYYKAVRVLGAEDGEGGKLEVSRQDNLTWKISAGKNRTVKIRYPLAVEKKRLNTDHCTLYGPDTYLYVVGRKFAPCSVRFTLPKGWRIGTGLERRGAVYSARDYDTFIDCPTELGKFTRLRFEEDARAYEIIIHSKGPVNNPAFISMCRKIVREHNLMFGPPPFKRYVFLFHFGGGTGGRGLEHLNSTDIDLPYVAVKRQPLIAASVTSHEYFHLWNVKRIRPVELGPFDYSREVESKALWLCEGWTSYFGDRALVRAGIWTEKHYFSRLAREIKALQDNPDRLVTSVERASSSVWHRKDYPRVDYYNKGELLGLLMDMRIRVRSGGRLNLDDVMRYMWTTYCVEPSRAGKGPIGVGYPEDGILKALNVVTGSDWSDFLDRFVSGTEELPYAEMLTPAGFSVGIVESRVPWLGVAVFGNRVMRVRKGSPAEKIGFRSLDTILALDGAPVTSTTLSRALAKAKEGRRVRVRVRRGGKLIDVMVTIRMRKRTAVSLGRAVDPSAFQEKLLDAWLGKRSDF